MFLSQQKTIRFDQCPLSFHSRLLFSLPLFVVEHLFPLFKRGPCPFSAFKFEWPPLSTQFLLVSLLLSFCANHSLFMIFFHTFYFNIGHLLCVILLFSCFINIFSTFNWMRVGHYFRCSQALPVPHWWRFSYAYILVTYVLVWK